MSPRYVSAIIAAIVTLGGAAILAHPQSILSQSMAQVPSGAPTAPSSTPTDTPNRGGGWLRNLNLSPDQVQRIQAIRNQYKDSLNQKRQAMHQAQQALRSLMAGNASADEVRTKYAEVKALRQELADTQFESMLAMREVLTVEQRQKFAAQMQQRRGEFKNRMRDRKEHRGPGGPGAQGSPGGLGGPGGPGL